MPPGTLALHLERKETPCCSQGFSPFPVSEDVADTGAVGGMEPGLTAPLTPILPLAALLESAPPTSPTQGSWGSVGHRPLGHC